jgi:hypothetical protein
MAAAYALCGCYTYRPASLDDVPPNAHVRALLSAEELGRLGSVVPIASRYVEGELLERGTGEVLLLVPVTSDVVGARVQTLHQRVRIPAAGILDLELKQLDRWKTTLVIGAGAAALGGIAVAAFSGTGRSDRPGPGPGPNELVIPLGAIRFGR